MQNIATNIPQNAQPGPWVDSSHGTMRTGFTLAGLGFLIVSAVSLIIAIALKSIVPDNAGRWDIFSEGSPQTTLLILFIVGIGLALAASATAWYWAKRLANSPPGTSLISIVVHGAVLGGAFGMIFLSLQVYEAGALFAIGGGIFLCMSAAGFATKGSKNLNKFLFGGAIGGAVCIVVAVILYLIGQYEDLWLLLVNILAPLFFLAYAALATAVLRRTQEWGQTNGKGFNDKIAWYYGFKMLSDIVGSARLAVSLARQRG